MSSPRSSGARGPARVALVVVVVVTTIGWPGGAGRALAHEFTLALVTPTSAASAAPNGSDVVDGFRLAVDQSPDVSHPPGGDAGDHLGGVDVDVIVIDGTRPADAAEALTRQLANGLTAAVVIAAHSTAQAALRELEGSSVLLVTAEGPGASAPPAAGALHLAQRPGSPFESSAGADLAAAFEREHGRKPSAAAALGYDAGRLLDAAVARGDDGVEDLDSVVTAASEVDDELVSSDISARGQDAAEGEPTKPKDAAAEAGPGGLLVAAVGTTLLLGLIGAVAGWRARRSRLLRA